MNGTPNISPSTFSYQLRDTIVQVLRTAAQGTGTLSAISNVRATAEIEGMLDTEMVAAGVQLVKFTPTLYAQHRRKVVTEIDVVLAARSVDTPTRGANLDDASALLEPLVDAGDGVNGLIPLLDTEANFSLGYAWESNISAVEFPYQIREGQNQEVWAFAVVHVVATTFVSF